MSTVLQIGSDPAGSRCATSLAVEPGTVVNVAVLSGASVDFFVNGFDSPVRDGVINPGSSQAFTDSGPQIVLAPTALQLYEVVGSQTVFLGTLPGGTSTIQVSGVGY